jgi:hypothetical protein
VLARGDLPVELGWPGDDDGLRRPAAGDGEAVYAVAGHEHEAACGRGPAVVVAEPALGYVLTKLGLRDRAAAIVYAFDTGLVAPGG